MNSHLPDLPTSSAEALVANGGQAARTAPLLASLVARFQPVKELVAVTQVAPPKTSGPRQSGWRRSLSRLARADQIIRRRAGRLRLRARALFSFEAAALLQAESVPQQSARDLQLDPSLAVPLTWASNAEVPTVRVAAVVHLFYDELALEIRQYLESIEEGVDVFISTGNAHQAQLIRTAFAGWARGSVEVRVVPNVGRDIAPKLVAFKDVYSRYEFVVLLHGKRSTHASVLAPWRQFTLESLLGGGRVASSILNIFDSQPTIGIVAAQHFEPVRRWLGWGCNFASSQILARRMGFRLDPKRPLDFPSGSMFWARSAALAPLLDLGLQFEDFDPERGQQDGTLAHAIEHLFFFACEHAGYDWVKIGQPELYESTPGIERLAGPQELTMWLRTKRYKLIPPYEVRTPWVESHAIPGPSPAFVSRVRRRALGGMEEGVQSGTRVAVGMPLVHSTSSQKVDAVGAVTHALDLMGTAGHRVLVGCDRETKEMGGGVQFVAQSEEWTLARMHNDLMAHAFAGGATHYVAMGPGVLPHCDAIKSMLTMSAVNFDRALIEAVPAVATYPATYDPLSFDLPDLRCDLLLIPRAVFEALSGLDGELSADIMGIDLAWRARACGFVLKACPSALFTASLQPQVVDERALLVSAKRLSKKWGGPAWLDERILELAARIDQKLPDITAERLPAAWLPYASFDRSFAR